MTRTRAVLLTTTCMAMASAAFFVAGGTPWPWWGIGAGWCFASCAGSFACVAATVTNWSTLTAARCLHCGRVAAQLAAVTRDRDELRQALVVLDVDR